jgi:Ca2+-transporting ATPase
VILASSLRDATLWAVGGGAIAFLALMIYVPALASLFSFAPLRSVDVAAAVVGAALSITWFELVKLGGKSRRELDERPG